MQVRQQKKDQRTKLKMESVMLHERLNKQSGVVEKEKQYSLGPGKGYITDKTLIKKEYVGHLGKRQASASKQMEQPGEAKVQKTE